MQFYHAEHRLGGGTEYISGSLAVSSGSCMLIGAATPCIEISNEAAITNVVVIFFNMVFP